MKKGQEVCKSIKAIVLKTLVLKKSIIGFCPGDTPYAFADGAKCCQVATEAAGCLDGSDDPTTCCTLANVDCESSSGCYDNPIAGLN